MVMKMLSNLILDQAKSSYLDKDNRKLLLIIRTRPKIKSAWLFLMIFLALLLPIELLNQKYKFISHRPDEYALTVISGACLVLLRLFHQEFVVFVENCLYNLVVIKDTWIMRLLSKSWIPFTAQRVEKFQEFKDAQDFIRERERVSYLKESPKGLIEDFKSDPKGFISYYFNSHQSLIKHYLMKAYVDDQVNESFVFNSLLIPRRKTLPTESLKNILYTISNLERYPYMLRKQFTDPDFMNKPFSSYTDAQLTLVFTRPFNVDVLFKTVTLTQEVFPVCSSVGEIADHVLIKREFQNQDIHKMDNQVFDGFRFRLLKTAKDYKDCGNIFSNCAKSYFSKNSDMLMVFKDNEPFACVEVVNRGEICEIKGPSNATLNFLEIRSIRRIVKQNC